MTPAELKELQARAERSRELEELARPIFYETAHGEVSFFRDAAVRLAEENAQLNREAAAEDALKDDMLAERDALRAEVERLRKGHEVLIQALADADELEVRLRNRIDARAERAEQALDVAVEALEHMTDGYVIPGKARRAERAIARIDELRGKGREGE